MAQAMLVRQAAMDADASTRASIEGLRALLREASVIQTEQYLDERATACILRPRGALRM